jgi:hypothetical protein
MKLVLNRLAEKNNQTLGTLNVIDSDNISVLELRTLELSWRGNEIGVSCIPKGNFEVVKRWSFRYGHHFWLNNVVGRSMVLIHSGNFKSQIRGCILVGLYFQDINNNGILDVVRSRDALEILDLLLPQKFTLTIK